MELKVIDLKAYLAVMDKLDGEPSKITEQLGPELTRLCKEVASSLREAGAVVVRDPRCSEEENEKFIEMMERYYESPVEYKRPQERPDFHYQVGITPEKVEVPRFLVDEKMQEKAKALPKESQPATPVGSDLKWRYMWSVGPRPSKTRFKELNGGPVIPESFPGWTETMNSWGYKMIAATEVVAEMAAIGFGLPKDAFTSLMKQGPHVLGPTGSDLQSYGQEGTVLAGYHYDTNFLTIHGRCRFPGLNIWVKNGQKVEGSVPEGCLLIQTGKEMEYLTAGDCIAGMHEVVVTEKTTEAIKQALEQNRSLWRVSSTLFAHIASEAVLKPLGHFAESPLASNYPPISAGEFTNQELSAISLKG
ncbi:uncharacterized protein LOC115986499 [Quercus lobata]|uniref:Non-haem dioxygenase N-terminal domain-containing protein n=1 Tax=Quercus lobata TaxID=97700 RepID=A0A7N2LAY7_QUELO|nr:uncharacterized protein LOC115986499 [Quercus lobata]